MDSSGFRRLASRYNPITRKVFYSKNDQHMKEFWNTRYRAEAYAYGTEPNDFFRQTLEQYGFSGKILLPAEGEGRNAVFAARQGLDVFAFDISEEGKNKALRLADQHQVRIHYAVGEFFDLQLVNEQYDLAALIFAHFPPPLLSAYHQKVASLIKPGGHVILEGFSKSHLPLRQADPKVGGPNNIDMLFDTDQIRSDFSDFEPLLLEEKEVAFDEGAFHQGAGIVVRFIGKKND